MEPSLGSPAAARTAGPLWRNNTDIAVDGETYMRTFVNTEITRAPSDGRTPVFYISTVENKGGFGQQAPNDDERLKMYGAQEFFIDYNRQTLEAVNGGQAIKKVYTAQKAGFNEQWDGTLKAADIYGIVTNYSQLHNNVQPSMTMRYNPDCSETSDARSCGLNGHCGSKLCPKHEFSYTVNGLPAYGAVSEVGFEAATISPRAWPKHDAGRAATPSPTRT